MEMYKTERFMLRNVHAENKKDLDYIKDIISSERHIKYIGVLESELHYNQFIIIEKNSKKIGLVRYTNIKDIPKIILLNIIADKEVNPLNIFMIFDVIAYFFMEKNVDKAMFQVKSINNKMLKLLKIFNIKKEGSIPYNEEYDIIFYGILKDEFEVLRNQINKIFR